MKKEMRRPVTGEISRAWEDNSAWRTAARLSCAIHCSDLPPGTFPTISMLNMNKLIKGSWREGTFTARALCEPSWGQVQVQNTTLLCTSMCRLHLEAVVCKVSQLEGKIGLHSPSRMGSWPGLNPDSWATEKELRWCWNTQETQKSLLFL